MPKRKLIPDVINNQELSFLPSGASVQEAVEIMAKRRIGAVMVLENGVLKGIFTERDVAFRVVAPKLDPVRTTLAQVMTVEPFALPPSATAMDALTLMEKRKFRHLPVVDETGVVGMVSVRDLFAVVRKQLEEEVQQRDDFIYGTSYSPEVVA